MYNFVYFTVDNEFYKISASDASKLQNVKIYYNSAPYADALRLYLYRFHTSIKMNQFLMLPYKDFWNRMYHFDKDFTNSKPYCFVFSPQYYQLKNSKTFEFLRDRYPGCKLVFAFRDRVQMFVEKHKNLSKSYNFDLSYLEQTFDLILTFNKLDSIKYGYQYFNDFTSYIPMQKDINYPLSDVFFAGSDKRRFRQLINIYDRLSYAGIKCEFFIVGVPKNKQVQREGIRYSEKWMSYKEMLYRSYNTECLLEISQEDAIGYTSRAIEAFMYNKKLITNSAIVLESPYYSKENVNFFKNVEDIDINFIKSKNKTDYHYKGDYSPVKFFQLIEKLLPG